MQYNVLYILVYDLLWHTCKLLFDRKIICAAFFVSKWELVARFCVANYSVYFNYASKVKVKGKGKGHFYLTSVVPSVPTRLLSMEADGAPSTPLPLSVLRFTGIQSYSYTDQRKVEADVEVTEDQTGDLSLRKPTH